MGLVERRQAMVEDRQKHDTRVAQTWVAGNWVTLLMTYRL